MEATVLVGSLERIRDTLIIMNKNNLYVCYFSFKICFCLSAVRLVFHRLGLRGYELFITKHLLLFSPSFVFNRVSSPDTHHRLQLMHPVFST